MGRMVDRSRIWVWSCSWRDFLVHSSTSSRTSSCVENAWIHLLQKFQRLILIKACEDFSLKACNSLPLAVIWRFTLQQGLKIIVARREYCKNCARQRRVVLESETAAMGNSSSLLSQYDLEDLQNHCSKLFSQREIIALYERFCQLDRTGKGFISADEFMSVPEFAVNPLCQRLLKMLEGLNFKEFIALLSAFSARATKDDKLKFIFKVYDTDGNGKVTSSDMLQILRDLSGSFLTDKQRQSVLSQALEQSGYTVDSALTLQDFKTVLDKADLKMHVEVPVD